MGGWCNANLSCIVIETNNRRLTITLTVMPQVLCDRLGAFVNMQLSPPEV
jgi:hypothetical protein